MAEERQLNQRRANGTITTMKDVCQACGKHREFMVIVLVCREHAQGDHRTDSQVWCLRCVQKAS